MIDGDKLLDDVSLILQCWSISPYCSKDEFHGAQDLLKLVSREVDELSTSELKTDKSDSKLTEVTSKIITNDMLVKFNSEVLQDSPLELRMCRNLSGCAECRLKSNIFIDSSIVNLNDTFFDTLKRFFKTYYNIELSFNNTGNIFWVRDGITKRLARKPTA